MVEAGGVAGVLKPALSAVEGNQRPKPLSSCDSNASVGFRAFAPRKANREALSKPLRQASAWRSSSLPDPDYVLGSVAAGLRQLQYRRSHRRSGECSSNARRPCPSTSLGAKFSENKNFGGGGSRTPVREALPPEDYMLIPFALQPALAGKPRFRRQRLERARNASG